MELDKAKVSYVKQRISLIKILQQNQAEFEKDELTFREHHNRFTSHLSKHFNATSYYLLLTCFDILGQEKEKFISFYNWLSSKDYIDERKREFDKIKNTENLENDFRDILKQYYKSYGVRTSFVNFITNVLHEEEKVLLMKSISITQQSTNQKYIITGHDYKKKDDKKKIDFLFMIRNKFTHTGYSIGEISMEKINHIIKKNDPTYSAEDYWVQVYSDKRKSYTTIYWINKWPNSLIEVLEKTINRYEN